LSLPPPSRGRVIKVESPSPVKGEGNKLESSSPVKGEGNKVESSFPIERGRLKEWKFQIFVAIFFSQEIISSQRLCQLCVCLCKGSERRYNLFNFTLLKLLYPGFKRSDHAPSIPDGEANGCDCD